MRVVFMGTPEFGVPPLTRLASCHEVVAAYTRPDKAKGRGRTPAPPPVKVAAEALGVPVLQPPSLRSPEEAARLASLRPDVVCVAAYGVILPPAILGVPRLGCINVHASLLPRWRGAAPVHRAILAGDDVTGVSIMRMEEGLDTGPYATQRRVVVDDLDEAGLSALLAEAGAEALLDVLRLLDDGAVDWIAQDDSLATYAEKVTASEVGMSPELLAEDALRRVRASSASAPCRLRIAQVALTVLAASRTDACASPGEVVLGKRDLVVGLSDGALSLARVRPRDRGEMDGASWARGARLPPGARWTGA